MSTPPNRTLLKSVLLLAILLPLVSLSQVKIKEKVEIKPMAETASRRGVSLADSPGRFFNPPFFVWDTLAHRPYLTLSANVTVTGSITFGADIGCGQYAKVYLGNYEIVGKGKTSTGSGCVAYDAPQPFVWNFSKASYPDVQMFVFDWQTADADRQPLTGDGNSISYSFSSYLRQGILPTSPPDVEVTAAATATGNYFLPPALFDHWELSENQTVLTCNNSMAIRMVPIDGYGELYGPVGISGYEAPVTVSVEGGGPYVFLSALGQEGTLVTTTLSDGCTLVFDPTRGGFTGDPKVVTVTVTGSGKSGTFAVTLTCERVYHFELTAVPTVLAQGMYSALTLIAKDADNQEFTFTEDFDVWLTVFSPDIFWPRWMGPPPFGSFVVDGGEPELAQIVVPYSVARAGRVQYFVESDILTTAGVDSMALTIRVERVDDASKNASRSVKVKRGEDCPLGVPTDRMEQFDKSATMPVPLHNSILCDHEDPETHQKDYGYTYPDGLEPRDPFEVFEGSIYAKKFKVRIEWGVCSKNFSSSAIVIDANLSQVTSENWTEIVDELRFSLTYAESNNAAPEFVKYWPWSVVEEHELVHVDTLQEMAVPYYQDLVQKINSIEPIRNWCKLSPEELLKASMQKLRECSQLLEDARDKFDAEFVKSAEVMQRRSYEAERKKLKQIIESIVTKFQHQ